VRVRFSALPDFLRSSGFGTESYLEGNVAATVQKAENTTVGIRHADHVAPSTRKKLALTSLTKWLSLGRYNSPAE
jgi:hypothetical protein